jgi:hypothetical protein
LDNNGLVNQFLHISHDSLFIRFIGVLARSSQLHHLAHHQHLLFPDLGDFLFVLIFSFQLCKSLSQHKRIFLSQVLVDDVLKLLDKNGAADCLLIPVQFGFELTQ